MLSTSRWPDSPRTGCRPSHAAPSTSGTYVRWPTIRWSGVFRPFGDCALPHRHRRRSSLGLDTFDYSFGYVANRAGGGETTAGIKATCERIQKTAASILRSFEEDEQVVA